MLRIDQVARNEALELRRAVLRPGLPARASEYLEDQHPETFHLGARDEPGGKVIGCAVLERGIALVG